MRLLNKAPNMQCRCCGAKRGDKPRSATFGLCDWCAWRFARALGELAANKADENQCNAWLAREVFMMTRRLNRFGVAARCQAMSNFSTNKREYEFLTEHTNQCKRWATAMRDGRPVCAVHANKRQAIIAFCDGETVDPYDQFSALFEDLAKIDPDFLSSLKNAVAACEREEAA